MRSSALKVLANHLRKRARGGQAHGFTDTAATQVLESTGEMMAFMQTASTTLESDAEADSGDGSEELPRVPLIGLDPLSRPNFHWLVEHAQ